MVSQESQTVSLLGGPPLLTRCKTISLDSFIPATVYLCHVVFTSKKTCPKLSINKADFLEVTLFFRNGYHILTRVIQWIDNKLQWFLSYLARWANACMPLNHPPTSVIELKPPAAMNCLAAGRSLDLLPS